MAEPLFAGAVHFTVACVLPGTADGAVGATGAPTVTAFVGTDCGPVPLEFRAAIRNVYVVPLTRPVTTWEVAVDAKVRAACAVVPIYGVTTYPLIAAPPLLAGTVHFTVASVLPGTAD